DFTKIRMTCPSTCGLMFAECRDFSTDRYSVVSGIMTDFTACTCTAIAGPAPAGLSAAVLCPQPATNSKAPARPTPSQAARTHPLLLLVTPRTSQDNWNRTNMLPRVSVRIRKECYDIGRTRQRTTPIAVSH